MNSTDMKSDRGRQLKTTFEAEVRELEARWRGEPRWQGVTRPYGASDVVRLRGSVVPECTLGRLGAERLWQLLTPDGYVHALGALSGGQAVQMVRAGLQAIYLSGWQVAATGIATVNPSPIGAMRRPVALGCHRHEARRIRSVWTSR